MTKILILIICFFIVITFSGCSIEKPKKYNFNITTLENQTIMLTKENNFEIKFHHTQNYFETINKNNIESISYQNKGIPYINKNNNTSDFNKEVKANILMIQTKDKNKFIFYLREEDDDIIKILENSKFNFKLI